MPFPFSRSGVPVSRLDQTRRARDIAVILARHGFTHLVRRANLAHHLPGRFFGKADSGQSPESAARRLAAALQDLGPVFVKFGQLLASRPGLLPDEYQKALEKLQDQVAPQPPETVQATLRDALGRPPGEVFASFDPEPLACGSIAQVHGATLPDGAGVAVKIRRRGIDRTVNEDLALLAWGAGRAGRLLPDLAPLDLPGLAAELGRALRRELDFLAEAAATAHFGRLAQGNRRLWVPRVHWEYTRRDVLTLDRAAGVPLTRPEDLAAAGLDARTVAATLAHALLEQYFGTGFFHADPHPGNLFATADGRVAMVDFGQTGRVSAGDRRRLAALLAALAHEDADLAAEIMAEMGQGEGGAATGAFHEDFADFAGARLGAPAGVLELGPLLAEATAIARRHGLRLPRGLMLMAKSMLTASGLVRRLDPGFRLDEAIGPYVREALSPRVAARGWPRRAWRQGWRLARLAEQGPEALLDIVRKVRQGRLEFVFRHAGLGARFAQAETAINRLSIGLIVAGITVASAIVLASGGGHERLGDLPGAESLIGRPLSITIGVAGLGMSLAILIGLWVIWGVLRTSRNPPPDGHDTG